MINVTKGLPVIFENAGLRAGGTYVKIKRIKFYAIQDIISDKEMTIKKEIKTQISTFSPEILRCTAGYNLLDHKINKIFQVLN
jgi:transcriptional regulator CtsR